MMYRLKPDYVLRGWDGMPRVLVKRPENRASPLPKPLFQLLMLCDGETPLEGLLDEAMEQALGQARAEGLVEPCPGPRPLDKEQYFRFYQNRYVNSIFWSITGRCNYRCRHCFMDAPCGRLGELTTAQALDFIDQMADCGVLRVDLTGGEPLVRRDFWQLVDRILARKMVIGKIYTNGWLLDEKALEQFERRGIRPDVSVSFDGVGWHDWMRGVPGAEQAALRALRLCADHGFRTDVEMCIHRGNLGSLPRTIQALVEAGVQEVKVSNVARTELWERSSEGNALTDQEYVEAMLPYIDWYYQAGRPIQKLTIANVAVLTRDKPGQVVAKAHDGTEQCRHCYLCGAARMACYITPEGRLLPCMPMTASPQQDRFPKIQDIGLRRGLSDSYYMQIVDNRVEDLLAANAECAACPYRYQCGGGCRATAVLYGDHSLMGCDRVMCMLWKGGYVERIQAALDDAAARYGAPV